MSDERTVNGVDPELLDRARATLHTQDDRTTVNTALQEVVAQRAREDFLDLMTHDGLPDLRDPDVMSQAWA